MIYNEEEKRVYFDYDNKAEIGAFNQIQEQIHSYKKDFGHIKMCQGLDCSEISCVQCPVGHIRLIFRDLEVYLQKIQMG